MREQLLGTLATVLTVLAYLPYLRAVWRARVRPHALSWVIWSVTTLVVFAAQVRDGAGAGAWAVGGSGLLTLTIAALALGGRGERHISRTDALFLLAAGGALVLWRLTADPRAAVLILTAVDLAGFGPTLRKAYQRPFEEHLGFFGLVAAGNALALLALERYTLATALFPAALGSCCAALVAMVLVRRRVLGRSARGSRAGGRENIDRLAQSIDTRGGCAQTAPQLQEAMRVDSIFVFVVLLALAGIAAALALGPIGLFVGAALVITALVVGGHRLYRNVTRRTASARGVQRRS